MSKLVIVESPAKAKTINKYLGKGYVVRASMGHVRDLPKSKMNVDVENDFEPKYSIIPGKKDAVTELSKLAKKSDEVFLATDLDREGEAIAWHLKEALKLPDKKVRRVVFNEITKPAIQSAFVEPRQINMHKVDAQQTRRILDRIVGYELSPLLWRKFTYGLSAGRVQSVVVRLIVEREREIEKFVPQEYWEIEAHLAPQVEPAQEPKSFKAKLVAIEGLPTPEAKAAAEAAGKDAFLLSAEAAARQFVEELANVPFVLTGLKRKEKSVTPPPPYITSTLQQQGSIQLHFSTKRTMMVAQQLYEGIELGAEGHVGLITYMRTDSLHVSSQALGACRDFISKNFPANYLPEKARFYASSESAQAAHEAIRPSEPARTPESLRPHLNNDQFRLYEMIWKRFVASQMAPGRLAVTDVEIKAGRGTFACQGKTLLFDGHMRVSGFDTESQIFLPQLTEGETLRLLEPLAPTQHATKPPPRYSDATLVRTLEKLGVGRPSTYAPIISLIQARKYVERIKGRYHATDLGKNITDALVAGFADIMNVEYTSHMENRLDEVEAASVDRLTVLREFYAPFSADLGKAMSQVEEDKKTEFVCEKCGKPMLKRWSRRGPFLGCSGYPECKFVQDLSAEGKPQPRVEAQVTEYKCELCSQPMILRQSRRGPFLGCSAYPKCKFTQNIDAEGKPAPKQELTDEKCEKCGKPMVKRWSKRGPFLGCSGYPACRGTKNLAGEPGQKKAANTEPTEFKCEDCGEPMLKRMGPRGLFLGCSAYPKCRFTQALDADGNPKPKGAKGAPKGRRGARAKKPETEEES